MSRAALVRRVAGARRFAVAETPAPLQVEADELPVRLRSAVADALEHVRAPGAQVVIRRRGRVLFSARVGVAAEDRFVLASVTKLATAAVVTLLAERGALGLDDPLSTWIPELPYAGHLTPRLLLAHRSGLREYARDREIRERLSWIAPDHPWERRELIDAIARLGPERGPDRRFAYRNSNYVVAAELAERAGGEAFAALLDRLIAQPLGLAGFSFAPTRLATPHMDVLRRPVDLLAVTGGRVPAHAIGPVWGDGGIASSATDLARFTEALFGGELVSPPTLAAMVKRTSRFGRRRGYGLGVTIGPGPSGTVAGHDGLYFGWTASASIDDASATVIAVVTNLAAPGVPAACVAQAARTALG